MLTSFLGLQHCLSALRMHVLSTVKCDDGKPNLVGMQQRVRDMTGISQTFQDSGHPVYVYIKISMCLCPPTCRAVSNSLVFVVSRVVQ